MLAILLKGIILGFAVAAPIGPVNLLCMRRTFVFGKLAGMISGFGSAMGDITFVIIALYGANAVSRFVVQYGAILHYAGGIILLVIAWKIYFNKMTESKHHDDTAFDFWKYFITTFLLTVTNPAEIFTFLAMFAGVGAKNHIALIIIGVFIGSMIWWTALAYGIAHLKISHDKFIIVNKVAAILIGLLGIISFLM